MRDVRIRPALGAIDRAVRVVIVGMAALIATQAHAQDGLEPIQCALCPTLTEVPWTYRVGGGTGVFDLPSDPNCGPTPGNPCPHYINNLRNFTHVGANRFVERIDFRVDAFDSELCCDVLNLSRAGLARTSLRGTPALGWYPLPADGTSLEAKPAFLEFATDLSVTRQGFNLGAVRVCCGTPDNDPMILSQSMRFSGVLLGDRDTVYYRTFNLGASQHQTLVLNGAPGTDFDLYLRCGALPTGTQFDFRGFSADSQEHLEIPQFCAAMFVAVNSFRGAGKYDLYMAFHRPGSHHTMTAGFDFAATAAQIGQFASTLQGAARRFFGATEGQHSIDRIDLFTNRDCGNCNGAACDICFRNAPGTANSPVCRAGTINVFQSYFGSPAGVAHEFGHRWFCLGDEYVNGNQWQCGHSIMANPFGDQHNFCYDGDHPRDPLPGAPPTGLASAWRQASNARVISSEISSTPDNYDFADFDFNGAVGVVIVH
jgi:hypothetical protein